MGSIYYGGSATPIHLDDHVLQHLKVVVVTKLRRGESFTVTWEHPEEQPRGRSTLWLHPAIPLRFVFDDPGTPALSQEWIQRLAEEANTSGGILFHPADIDTVRPDQDDDAPHGVQPA